MGECAKPPKVLIKCVFYCLVVLYRVTPRGCPAVDSPSSFFPCRGRGRKERATRCRGSDPPLCCRHPTSQARVCSTPPDPSVLQRQWG